jgi:ribosomal-protein-serine acetyltransferase
MVPDETNAAELAALVEANLAHLGQWMIWAVEDYDLDHARAFIRQNIHDVSSGKGMTFSIFLQGKIIGGIGFVKLDRIEKTTEIGYWIDSAHEGKGYVTACCRTLIDHAFDREQMRRIEIRASSANLRSRAVPERLGFTLEGKFAGEHSLPGGKFDDLVVYSMAVENWQRHRSRL